MNYANNTLVEHLPARFYKTRICKYFMSGVCHHGSRCSFAHTFEELRSNAEEPRATNWNTVNSSQCSSCTRCSQRTDLVVSDVSQPIIPSLGEPQFFEPTPRATNNKIVISIFDELYPGASKSEIALNSGFHSQMNAAPSLPLELTDALCELLLEAMGDRWQTTH